MNILAALVLLALAGGLTVARWGRFNRKTAGSVRDAEDDLRSRAGALAPASVDSFLDSCAIEPEIKTKAKTLLTLLADILKVSPSHLAHDVPMRSLLLSERVQDGKSEKYDP